MKKLDYTAWNGCSLEYKFCSALLQHRNPQLKSFIDILSKNPLYKSRSLVAEQQEEVIKQSSAKYFNRHAHPTTGIGIGSNLAIQNPNNIVWDIYGIITATII